MPSLKKESDEFFEDMFREYKQILKKRRLKEITYEKNLLLESCARNVFMKQFKIKLKARRVETKLLGLEIVEK
jgi:hypothetical protein